METILKVLQYLDLCVGIGRLQGGLRSNRIALRACGRRQFQANSDKEAPHANDVNTGSGTTSPYQCQLRPFVRFHSLSPSRLIGAIRKIDCWFLA
jgi:hypothetical protein